MKGRSATAKRQGRKIRLQARYSHEYPVEKGHNYLLRSIPADLWKRAIKRALAEQRSMRVILIRALEQYAAGRLIP